jgi:hypothetical protein
MACLQVLTDQKHGARPAGARDRRDRDDLAQSMTAVVIFWAIIGGLGASLPLPAMQSLIHGNFEGAAMKKTYALVGASAAGQEKIVSVLEDNAEFVSTTRLETLLADQPGEIQEEIIQINSDAGDRSLQFAMPVPILACLLGFINAFRMMRLPDIKPSADIEGLLSG